MIFHFDCYMHSSQSPKHKVWLTLHFPSTYKLYNIFITNDTMFQSNGRVIFLSNANPRSYVVSFVHDFDECSNICQMPHDHEQYSCSYTNFILSVHCFSFGKHFTMLRSWISVKCACTAQAQHNNIQSHTDETHNFWLTNETWQKLLHLYHLEVTLCI